MLQFVNCKSIKKWILFLDSTEYFCPSVPFYLILEYLYEM